MNKILDGFGMTLREGRIVYVSQSRLRWVPRPIKKMITGIWNRTACALLGHRWLFRHFPGALPICSDCSRYVRKFDETKVINTYEDL